MSNLFSLFGFEDKIKEGKEITYTDLLKVCYKNKSLFQYLTEAYIASENVAAGKNKYSDSPSHNVIVTRWVDETETTVIDDIDLRDKMVHLRIMALNYTNSATSPNLVYDYLMGGVDETNNWAISVNGKGYDQAIGEQFNAIRGRGIFDLLLFGDSTNGAYCFFDDIYLHDAPLWGATGLEVRIKTSGDLTFEVISGGALAVWVWARVFNKLPATDGDPYNRYENYESLFDNPDEDSKVSHFQREAEHTDSLEESTIKTIIGAQSHDHNDPSPASVVIDEDGVDAGARVLNTTVLNRSQLLSPYKSDNFIDFKNRLLCFTGIGVRESQGGSLLKSSDSLVLEQSISANDGFYIQSEDDEVGANIFLIQGMMFTGAGSQLLGTFPHLTVQPRMFFPLRDNKNYTGVYLYVDSTTGEFRIWRPKNVDTDGSGKVRQDNDTYNIDLVGVLEFSPKMKVDS